MASWVASVRLTRSTHPSLWGWSGDVLVLCTPSRRQTSSPKVLGLKVPPLVAVELGRDPETGKHLFHQPPVVAVL